MEIHQNPVFSPKAIPFFTFIIEKEKKKKNTLVSESQYRTIYP
jgi:hypothetical protein